MTVHSKRSYYDTVAMSLHWLIALLMIPMLFFGDDLIKRQPDAVLPSVHASVGIAILVLSLLRLGWRFAHPAPPLPVGTPGWEELGSKVVQTLFYVLMIGLPLTGLLALPRRITQHPEISGISLFGLFPI